jgi:hypothetical protein
MFIMGLGQCQSPSHLWFELQQQQQQGQQKLRFVLGQERPLSGVGVRAMAVSITPVHCSSSQQHHGLVSCHI